MDKLHRNPLLSDITLETVVDYTVDFMRIVGTPRVFTDKVVELTVVDYKTALPEDWYENIQIRFMGKKYLDILRYIPFKQKY